MKNNDKLRAAMVSSDPSALAALDDSTELAFPTQTDFVELPSQGKLYPEGHPWHNKQSVEIKFMTAKEEDILTSKTYIAKNVVLEKFINSILVDKNVPFESILVGDKAALLVAARVTGYGEHYSPKVRCPACSTISDLDVNLNELNKNTYEDIEKLDFGSFGDDGYYEIKDLPVSKYNVKVKILNGKDEKTMESMAEMKKKRNLPETSNTDFLKNVIVSVNNETDKVKITNFINNLPAKDSQYIRIVYEQITPKIELKQTLVCTECMTESDVEVPISAEFFWPRR
jgi:hypothetical protein